MAIQACLRCGSNDMRTLTMHDGMALEGGENSGKRVCRACDWQGIPILFDDVAAWTAFREGLVGSD